MHVYVCVLMYMCRCVCVCVCTMVHIYCFILHFKLTLWSHLPLPFDGQFLYCTWGSLLAGQQVLGACLWVLPELGLQMCVPINGFHLGA